MTWRYHAFKTTGGGVETPVAWDLPLSGVSILDDLSGPGGLEATVTPVVARLRDESGDPVFVPWSTILYAEADGVIRGAGILEDMEVDGPNLRLTCRGFAAYPTGTPYTGDRSWVKADPLDVVRHVWEYVQGFPNSNLGVKVDSTRSPVRIGEEPRDVEFTTGAGEDVSFEAGPYTLNWWGTDDLGKEIDDLATETPFDYRMEHQWAGERVEHFLRIGYPKLGARKHDLRFAVGENITMIPQVSYDGAEYASDVLVRGAGEGRDMIRGQAWRQNTGRLRRILVVADKSVKSRARANALAEQEVKLALGEEDFSELTIMDHPNAPIGTFRVGDEIEVTVPEGWHRELTLWVRVMSMRTEPAAGRVTATVVRSEKA